eukprot:g16871.t1
MPASTTSCSLAVAAALFSVQCSVAVAVAVFGVAVAVPTGDRSSASLASSKKCWKGRAFPYDSAANAHLWEKNVLSELPHNLIDLEELPSEFSWRSVEWAHVLKTSKREKPGEQARARAVAGREQQSTQIPHVVKGFLDMVSPSLATKIGAEQKKQHDDEKASFTSSSLFQHVQELWERQEEANELNPQDLLDAHATLDRFDKILPRLIGNVTKHVEHYLAPQVSDTVSMLTPIWNQHIPRYCGACWLHAGVAVMNDRLKIARQGKGEDIILSRQAVLNCGKESAGSCQGGSDTTLFDYVQKTGIPDESCQVYEAQDFECTAFRTCMNCDPSADGRNGTEGPTGCYAVQRFAKYFVSEYGLIDVTHIAMELSSSSSHLMMPPPPPALQRVLAHAEMIRRMKAEIYLRGPITCSVDSAIMLKFPRGHILHTRQPGKGYDFDHLIGVVGWGIASPETPTWPEEGRNRPEGTPFWLVRNSWGTAWGDDGGETKILAIFCLKD